MWWMVLASLLFPGFGQALVHRKVRALVWAVAAVMALVAVIWSVWFFGVWIVLHIAAAFDAARVLKRDARPGGLNRMFGAAVLVGGAVGFGLARMCVEGFRIPSSSMYPTIEIGDHIFVDKLTLWWRPVERGEVIVHRYPCSPGVVFVKRVVAVGGDAVEVRCDVLYVNGKAMPHTLVAKDWEYEARDEASAEWMRQRVSRWHEQVGDHSYDVFEGTSAPGERDFPRLDVPIVPGCADPSMFRGPTKTHEIRGTFRTTKSAAHRCEPQMQYIVPEGAVFVLGDNRYNANDSRYWGPVREDDVLGRVVGVWSNTGPSGFLARFGDLQ
jgi:signal peptidase I